MIRAPTRKARVRVRRNLIAGSIPAVAFGEIAQIAVAESGGSMILTEGGPTVLGEFLRARELDELFVTIAPRIAGRDARERRLALVEGAAFGPDEMREMKLVSVKAAHDYLFTRFAAR